MDPAARAWQPESYQSPGGQDFRIMPDPPVLRVLEVSKTRVKDAAVDKICVAVIAGHDRMNLVCFKFGFGPPLQPPFAHAQ